MKKVILIFVFCIATCAKFYCQKSDSLNYSCHKEIEKFFEIDKLVNDSIETFNNCFAYKNSKASTSKNVYELNSYYSELYIHFKKHIEELGQIIVAVKKGSDNVKIKPKGTKDDNSVYLILYEDYKTFNKYDAVLIVIKNGKYTVKIICPSPW